MGAYESWEEQARAQHEIIRQLEAKLAEAERLIALGEGAYLGSAVLQEVLAFFTAAGFGQPGQPNTLWAVTQQALARLAEAERERDGFREGCDHRGSVLTEARTAANEQGDYLHDADGDLARAIHMIGMDLRFNIEKRTAIEAREKALREMLDVESALRLAAEAKISRVKAVIFKWDNSTMTADGVLWWAASSADFRAALAAGKPECTCGSNGGDAWKCAKRQGRTDVISCRCLCHRYIQRSK